MLARRTAREDVRPGGECDGRTGGTMAGCYPQARTAWIVYLSGGPEARWWDLGAAFPVNGRDV